MAKSEAYKARTMVKKWIWKEFAETLGVIGVIGSLAFVGLEIRQNTTAVRSQAAQGVMDQVASMYQAVIADPAVADIISRGIVNPSSLSAGELAQFQAYFIVAFHSLQNMYVQVREGALDPGLAEGWWQMTRTLLDTPGIKFHWETRSFVLSPEFREFVETEIAAREPNAGYTPFGVGGP